MSFRFADNQPARYANYMNLDGHFLVCDQRSQDSGKSLITFGSNTQMTNMTSCFLTLLTTQNDYMTHRGCV